MFRLESGELKSEETAPYAVAIAAGSTGVGGVVNVSAAVEVSVAAACGGGVDIEGSNADDTSCMGTKSPNSGLGLEPSI